MGTIALLLLLVTVLYLASTLELVSPKAVLIIAVIAAAILFLTY